MDLSLRDRNTVEQKKVEVRTMYIYEVMDISNDVFVGCVYANNWIEAEAKASKEYKIPRGDVVVSTTYRKA